MIETDDPYKATKLLIIVSMGQIAWHLCHEDPALAEKLKSNIATHSAGRQAEEEHGTSAPRKGKWFSW